MNKTITFTQNGNLKVEEATVVFEGSLQELQSERAALEERVAVYEARIAEMEGELAKLIARRDEKDALIASVQVKATAENVDLKKAATVEDVMI